MSKKCWFLADPRVEEPTEASSQEVVEQLLESVLEAMFPEQAATEEAATALQSRVNVAASPEGTPVA